MFSFASMRPLTARWRGWLPPLALALFMFAALLALGGDRGYLYGGAGIHNFSTTRWLAISENLSPEHSFRIFDRVWRDEGGGFAYSHYGRFPIGGFALVKLAILPFGDDLATKLLAARALMLLMFCGAALFAFLAASRITDSRRVALAATLLAFSGFYAVYLADSVLSEGVMDLFGAALVFHGMAVFVQEGRFRQLAVKTCAALLLGWHVYALILPFAVLGFGGAAIAVARSALASSDRSKAARAAIISLARSRYVALPAIAFLFGAALLAFNLANEWASYGGERTLSELPSVRSALRRAGQTESYKGNPQLAWDNFLRRQFYRAGVAATPYAVVRAGGYEFPLNEPPVTPLAPSVWGMAAAALAALGTLALAPRCRILTATAVLFGFCWSIPMRHHTFTPEHVHEGLPYVWLALALFAAAPVGARRLMDGRLAERAFLAIGARRLMDGRLGERAFLAIGAAAALAFALAVFYAGQFDRYDGDAERGRAVMAEFSEIRRITRGKSVEFVPHQPHSWTDPRDPFKTLDYLYYLAGSYVMPKTPDDACDTRGADFVVSRYRDESLNLLTPENRFAFLYEGLEPAELCRAERRALESQTPAARSTFDVYLQDDSLSYLKAPCDARDYEAPFYLYVYPVHEGDLTKRDRRNGFLAVDPKKESATYKVADFDGACLLTVYLPDYPIKAIQAGQWIPGVERLWTVFISPPPSAETLAFYEKAYQEIASSGAPAARSDFDLYPDVDVDALSYLKAPCGEEDTRGRFFLSVHPADAEDLPEDRRAHGHESLNFTFAPPVGVVFNGKCMATRPLPDYDIAKIETGQWIPGGDQLWRAEIAVGD